MGLALRHRPELVNEEGEDPISDPRKILVLEVWIDRHLDVLVTACLAQLLERFIPVGVEVSGARVRAGLGLQFADRKVEDGHPRLRSWAVPPAGVTAADIRPTGRDRGNFVKNLCLIPEVHPKGFSGAFPSPKVT